jgi:hypothetical protein
MKLGCERKECQLASSEQVSLAWYGVSSVRYNGDMIYDNRKVLTIQCTMELYVK